MCDLINFEIPNFKTELHFLLKSFKFFPSLATLIEAAFSSVLMLLHVAIRIFYRGINISMPVQGSLHRCTQRGMGQCYFQ